MACPRVYRTLARAPLQTRMALAPSKSPGGSVECASERLLDMRSFAALEFLISAHKGAQTETAGAHPLALAHALI